MSWEQCSLVQGAIDATEPSQQKQLEALCKELCKDGLAYDKAIEKYTQVSSKGLARAEKTLGLTSVHYHPFQHEAAGH